MELRAGTGGRCYHNVSKKQQDHAIGREVSYNRLSSGLARVVSAMVHFGRGSKIFVVVLGVKAIGAIVFLGRVVLVVVDIPGLLALQRGLLVAIGMLALPASTILGPRSIGLGLVRWRISNVCGATHESLLLLHHLGQVSLSRRCYFWVQSHRELLLHRMPRAIRMVLDFD